MMAAAAERPRGGVKARSSRRRAGNKLSSILKNEDVAQRRAALEAAIRKKFEYEKKALRIVEQLLEEDITEEFLVNCGNFITPSHYKDAVEERFIIRLCGYPLCRNRLKNVPKQKYRVSTKTNKVYDITERKCFCSNFCYRASKYFEAQIPKSPVWMREEERPPDIELLKEGQSGRSGEEVKLHDEVIKVSDIENPKTSASQCDSGSHSTYSDSSSDTEQEFVSSILPENRSNATSLVQPLHKKSILKKKPIQNINSTHRDGDHRVINVTEQLSECKLDIQEKKSSCSVTDISSDTIVLENLKNPENYESRCNGSQVVLLGVSKKGAEQLKKILAKSKQHIKPEMSAPLDSHTATRNVLDVLKQTFIEWRTEETYKFLCGSSYATVHLPEHTSAVNCEKEELDEDDLETADDLNDTAAATRESKNSLNQSLPFGGTGATVKPLPSYEKLKEETELLGLKVKEFYKGKCLLSEEATTQAEGAEHPSSVKDDQQGDPILPLVDSHAQMQIRKQIVLEKLRKVLPAVLGPLQITLGDVYMELKNLVKTFRLTNTNIIHKIPEWTLIAVVLLSVLSQIIPVFANSQQSPVYTQFLSTLLEELHFTKEDLESLTRIFRHGSMPEWSVISKLWYLA
ncbi:putative RNA polymerase II subunit B1 CTD phosphatase RPAP2 isoform X2 [Gopherus flavomarginatus]|uniref:putative RNA polymerase II subunit B1 CTD phosphatase RPAP2 isoform X2 n=1 Tax=Gopherus flavomarginatus TaxID=286002 RepID=UPI0021CBB24D|nr:putative RNA polymerase II subunit B1 CTD phosphatase RPAP2 isoform X2 [Gopherus flavomarginatus]